MIQTIIRQHVLCNKNKVQRKLLIFCTESVDQLPYSHLLVDNVYDHRIEKTTLDQIIGISHNA